MDLKVLSDEQIQKLHVASLEILETVGVDLPHEKALELFRESGAEVDWENKNVRIPESVVSHALDVCGKQFAI